MRWYVRPIYARQGVDVYVATATRGEQGALGTGGMSIEREELPAVREAELRSVLEMIGARAPISLGYRDGELASADFEELAGKVAAVMKRVGPDIVITFGPSGISSHEDHIAVHRATVEAFHSYRDSSTVEARLFYIAVSDEIADRFELRLDESETTPTVSIYVKEYKAVKMQALKTYRSQEDIQQFAEWFETGEFDVEAFHQAYPKLPDGDIGGGFW